MFGNHLIILIGAVVLSALLITNSTKQISSSTDRTIETGKITTAVSLGEKLIKQISSKSFDENCLSDEPTDSLNFSSQLKAESGETFSNYDDVDDFNNYKDTVTNNLGTYNLSVSVSYVKSDNFDTESYTQTRTKKIGVLVYSSSLLDTVKLYYYKAY